MDDVSTAAADTAVSTPAPEAQTSEPATTPNPIRTDPQSPDPKPATEAKPEPKSESAKRRDALSKAADAVETAEKAAKAPKPVKADPDTKAQEGPLRGQNGQFASKEGQQPADPAKPVQTAQQPVQPQEQPKPTVKHEAPARFKSDAAALADWEKTPEAVQAAINRTHRELEAGIEKYRAAATAFEDLKEFDDLARQHNTTMKQAMTNYIGIERLLLQDPVRGLEQIANNIGFSLRDIAAHIMGQTPDQARSQQDATMREMANEINRLKQQINGVSGTVQERATADTVKAIEAFASTPEHSRFEELADDIEFFLNSGRTKDLAEAYKLAEKLNPAPPPPVTAPQVQEPVIPALRPPAPSPDLKVQTDKGGKSITGAPGPGSDPVIGKPSNSIREALRKAAAAAV